ncbi:hypothetical protein FIU89_02270 [Roseovarius sp. THAF27]|uniref:hypothetical protein n=1 Tax=Roseovarius sp. THAF27 TaxID=2587850 RepID=UPI001269832C|nr:hypothetical protein [Roseovarius sp. THAF27]QFT79420.1 hypothetical protein FIU89_02270 [Roseovarius sp. THAF27]
MAKTVYELGNDAVFLAGLIGGAELIADTVNTSQPTGEEYRLASNSLLPIFEDLRRRADALVRDIETLDLQSTEGAGTHRRSA